jgi:putative signal transducing protein
MEDRKQEWVEVAQSGNDEEAGLIAGLLESLGIPVEVEGPSGASPWPENLGAFGMSRVMVPPEQAAQARELLAQRQRQFREHPLEDVSSSSEDDE